MVHDNMVLGNSWKWWIYSNIIKLWITKDAPTLPFQGSCGVFILSISLKRDIAKMKTHAHGNFLCRQKSITGFDPPWKFPLSINEIKILQQDSADFIPWFTILTPLPPGQNGRHLANDILWCIFMNGKFCILIKISVKFVPRGPIGNNSGLVQVMAWRQTGDKPLAEPMLTRFTDAYMWHLGEMS